MMKESGEVSEQNVKAIKVLSALLIFAVTFAVMTYYFYAKETRSISGNSLNMPFVVLVLSRDDVQLIFHQDEVEDYRREHPDYSFLIPVGQEQQVSDKLFAQCEASNAKARPYLDVEAIGPGRQLVTIELCDDRRHFTYWYEATDKEVSPRGYRMFGGLDIMASLFISTILTTFLYYFGKGALNLFLELRRTKLHQ